MKNQDVINCLNSMIENVSFAKRFDIIIGLKQLTNKVTLLLEYSM